MPHGSGLFYHGTDVEVRVGDRVILKRFVRRPLSAVVCYIPGISPRHSELEYEDVRQWAVRAEDGTIYPIAYAPAVFQPPTRVVFVARGSSGELPPEEELL